MTQDVPPHAADVSRRASDEPGDATNPYGSPEIEQPPKRSWTSIAAKIAGVLLVAIYIIGLAAQRLLQDDQLRSLDLSDRLTFLAVCVAGAILLLLLAFFLLVLYWRLGWKKNS